jgi:hypothetical protein
MDQLPLLPGGPRGDAWPRRATGRLGPIGLSFPRRSWRVVRDGGAPRWSGGVPPEQVHRSFSLHVGLAFLPFSFAIIAGTRIGGAHLKSITDTLSLYEEGW